MSRGSVEEPIIGTAVCLARFAWVSGPVFPVRLRFEAP
jgi:hypothetical protein